MENMDSQKKQQEMIELHPYEYLSKLNSINSSCNKANIKSYSSASRVKLPWKPFNIVKIPQHFQKTYEYNRKMTHKQTQKEEGPVDGIEKKMWKQHEQILRKHTANKENFKNTFRPKTAYRERKALAQQTLGKSKMTQNFFLQRVVEKGGKFQYDREQLKQQVLSKLKKISTQKSNQANFGIKESKQNPLRIKSAFVRTPKNKQTYGIASENLINSIARSHNAGENDKNKDRKIVEENQYLSFQKSQELIAKYKENIRQVDGSISELNVKKTVKLLKNLQTIADNLL